MNVDSPLRQAPVPGELTVELIESDEKERLSVT